MWAEEDRPREKMMSYGKSYMTDAEILSIVIGSGTKDASAYDLAKQILASYDNQIGELNSIRWKDLVKFKGIGPAKAVDIIAALEFGKRIFQENLPPKISITSSRQAFTAVQSKYSGILHEEFWIILMNKANKIISVERISTGGVSSTLVDPKIVFSKALDKLASSIILSHNHPSGSLKPSVQDINLTKKLCECAAFLEIKVWDHLIIADEKYFSFADNNMIS